MPYKYDQAERLARALIGGTNTFRAPFDEDAQVVAALDGELQFLDLSAFEDAGEQTRRGRAMVRYLVALFPHETSLPSLANRIHAVLGNPHLDEADIRRILDGRSAKDPSVRYQHIPYQRIQMVGAALMDGKPRTEAARVSGISVDTVTIIDEFLGLSVKRRSQQLDVAADAVREGWSVRQCANVLGVPRNTAHRLMHQARAILVELGELVEVAA
jgi:hypothetical protein